MNKEELYNLALSDVHKYNLLNEIFAIRDKRVETVDYTIGVNGFISLDVLNRYVNKINENTNLKQALIEIEELLTEPTLEAIWKIPKCIKIIDKALNLDKVRGE